MILQKPVPKLLSKFMILNREVKFQFSLENIFFKSHMKISATGKCLSNKI